MSRSEIITVTIATWFAWCALTIVIDYGVRKKPGETVFKSIWDATWAMGVLAMNIVVWGKTFRL